MSANKAKSWTLYWMLWNFLHRQIKLWLMNSVPPQLSEYERNTDYFCVMLHEWLIKSLCSSGTSCPGSHCTCISILASWAGSRMDCWALFTVFWSPACHLQVFCILFTNPFHNTWDPYGQGSQGNSNNPTSFPAILVFYRSYFSCHYNPIFEEEGFIFGSWTEES